MMHSLHSGSIVHIWAALGMLMSTSVDIFGICQAVPHLFDWDKVLDWPKWQHMIALVMWHAKSSRWWH